MENGKSAISRVTVIVLDGVGAGEAPDAILFNGGFFIPDICRERVADVVAEAELGGEPIGEREYETRFVLDEQQTSRLHEVQCTCKWKSGKSARALQTHDPCPADFHFIINTVLGAQDTEFTVIDVFDLADDLP